MTGLPIAICTVRSLMLAAAATLLTSAAAQSPGSCAATGYTAPDPATPIVAVERVAGQAVFAPPGALRDIGSATGLCLTLFVRSSQRPVLRGVSGENGGFDLSTPALGEYVLVASPSRAQPLVVPLRVASAEGRDASRGVLLHMRTTEDTRASFATTIGSLELRAELLALLERDQAIRQEMIARGAASIDPELESRMADIDTASTARIVQIVDRHGWPTPALAGEDGSSAASTLVQHATPEVQRRMLGISVHILRK